MFLYLLICANNAVDSSFQKMFFSSQKCQANNRHRVADYRWPRSIWGQKFIQQAAKLVIQQKLSQWHVKVTQRREDETS